LILGDDLQGESPFAQAVLIRGQHQEGLHLTVAHPRRVKLARPKFGGDWLAVKPGGELALLHALTLELVRRGVPEGTPPAVAEALRGLTRSLAEWSPDK